MRQKYWEFFVYSEYNGYFSIIISMEHLEHNTTIGIHRLGAGKSDTRMYFIDNQLWEILKEFYKLSCGIFGKRRF